MTEARTRTSLWLLVVFLAALPDAFAHHGGYAPTGSGEGQDRHSISSGGMVNSPTASTFGQGHGALGFAWDAVRYNAIPAEDAHDLHEAGRDIHGKNHEETYNLHAGYGLSRDVDLYLVAPIVSKAILQIHDEDHLGRHERATGLGDLRVLGKYRFWHQGVEAALLMGIKMPTGATAEHDRSNEKFEPEQQPGSGSWDGELGVAVSRSFRRHVSVASSFHYTLKGEGAQGLKEGDVFRYNIGTSYALRPLGQQPNVSLVLELNNEWALRDHSRTEDRVFDSGGTSVFVSPGLTAELTDHLSAFWAMPIPIHQNLGGEHEELKYEIIAGASCHF